LLQNFLFPFELRLYIKSGYIGMIKKPLQAQQSAESEGEEGNLNNSDTNGNDITTFPAEDYR